MFLIEIQKGRTWKREAVKFETLEDAEKYAERLYREGKTARVVDERYRK